MDFHGTRTLVSGGDFLEIQDIVAVSRISNVIGVGSTMMVTRVSYSYSSIIRCYPDWSQPIPANMKVVSLLLLLVTSAIVSGILEL